MSDNPEKLERLAEIEGMEEFEMLSEASTDSVVPGICTNPGCDYSTSVEPDSRTGWCEECKTNTVASALTLAGII